MDTPVVVSPLQVHTTDRATFRSCRLRWHFSSNLRLNLRPAQTPEALLFGSAIHAGLAYYYENNKDLHLGLVSFESYLENWFETETDQGPEAQEQYTTLVTLGKDMLWHYDDTYKHDGLKVEMVEAKFEVRLGDCPYCNGAGKKTTLDWKTYSCRECNGTGDLLYSFQIDGLVRDEHNRPWILEHKTAKSIEDDTDYLQMDDQCGSYLWGVEQAIGLRCEGVIYNTLVKAAPQAVKVNLNGSFSVDKRQNTTYKIAYEQFRKEFGTLPMPEKEQAYLDYLAYGFDSNVILQGQPNKFFRRVAVRRTPAEIEAEGHTIEMEIADMLDPKLRIYRNPNRFNCGGCPFKAPCISYYSGGDVEATLRGNYIGRD